MARITNSKEPGPLKFPFEDLKSVQWAQGQKYLMFPFKTVAGSYAHLRQLQIVGWGILMVEVQIVWWWSFLNDLSWLQGVVGALAWLDTKLAFVLESVQLRLEWYWDVAGVRCMWLRESLENAFDKRLTTLDNYLDTLQDWMWTIVTCIRKPFVALAYSVTRITSKRSSSSKKSFGNHEKTNRNGSLRRNSEGYEAEDHEDWGDDDYLSDASLDSRRLMKENSKGESYLRLHTTAKAEGRFREAMYHRVRNELGIMRKNSIRFSRGIVNYARQMVVLHPHNYGTPVLELCQRWAKGLGIWNWMQMIQDELKDQPFHAKPLVLAQVLIEPLLASLLRLVRGKNRRTRSMRSESLRRRALQSLNGTSNLLPLSPVALQQSSEPVPHHHLPVQTTLRQEALKEEEEDLEGFLSKDSALGSEDNHSETIDSDQTISQAGEDQESDSDVEHSYWNTNDEEEGAGPKENSKVSQKTSTLCTGSHSPSTSKSLQASLYSQNVSNQQKKDSSSKKKRVTIQ